MIYIDRLMNHGMTIRGCSVQSCHLWSDDSLEELIKFGKKIGMKEEWIHTGIKHQDHFDLVPSKRLIAIKNGAKEIRTLDEYRRTTSRPEIPDSNSYDQHLHQL